MLQKWRLIINNWINCYFEENNTDERVLKTECLLNIISHLRENLNLDESKSSILEAHTVEQFILEKYPNFKFENGTKLASNEEDIYLAASLLLFFVCVTSKDVNMKSAMCSKLSREDQEIILKFSKNLMECNPITCRDVQTAIADACGTDIASVDTGHVTIAETPPVLRSLHSEVRKLQAALDAERFDRNFLQDELMRTNLKLEKLVKDKEQYKVDIMNLKTKLSLCSSGDHIARGVESESEQSAKLARQLEDLEEHLVRTQELLDDAVCERDDYKTKIQLLKEDRDKWLSLSQQESARAVQLAEDLETERRNMQSLRELVTDLRQHNRLNGLDVSQLDCDDPDTSVQSLAHNISVCSEVCANIIEVQLTEEKAKVEALKQQLEAFQVKVELYEKDCAAKDEFITKLNIENDAAINNMNKELTAEKTLRERCENDIEEKNTAINQLKHDLNKLNEEKEALNIMLRENEERIKALEEREPPVCDGSCAKVIEIQVQLSKETAKVDALKQQIESLKSIQDELASDKITLLNKCDMLQSNQVKAEKELKERKKEVVHLQKEMQGLEVKIESCEKDSAAKEAFIIKMNNEKDTIINNVNKELTAEKILRESYQKDIEEKNRVMDQLKHNLNKLNDEREEKDKIINDMNKELTAEKILRERCQKDIEDNNIAMDQLKHDLNKLNDEREEKDKIINDMNKELTAYKILRESCQKDIEEKNKVMDQLKHDLNKLNGEREEKYKIINYMNKELTAEKILRESCQKGIEEKNRVMDQLKHDLNKLIDVREEKDKIINDVNKEFTAEKILRESCQKDIEEKNRVMDQLKHDLNKLNDEREEKDKIINDMNKELISEKFLRESCQKDIEEKNTAIDELKHDFNKLNDERAALNVMLAENKELIKTLEEREPPICDGSCAKVIEVQVQLSEETAKVAALKQQIELLQDEMNNDKQTFISKCDILQDYKISAEKELQEREQEDLYLLKEIQVLQNKVETCEKDSAAKDEFINKMNNEKEVIINNMNKELTAEKILRERCEMDVEEKNTAIEELKHDLIKLNDEREETGALINNVNKEFTAEKILRESCQKDMEKKNITIDQLKHKLNKLNDEREELEEIINNVNKELAAEKILRERCEKDVEEKISVIDQLKYELNKLNDERKEKDVIINNMDKELTAEKILNERCQKNIEEKNTAIDELKHDLNKLNDEREALNVMLKENKELIKTLEQREPPICDGSCAKVIEVQVQLTEESAKVVSLKQQIEALQDEMANDKVKLTTKCDILQNLQLKAEKELEGRQNEISTLQKEIEDLHSNVESLETASAAKDQLIAKMNNEKDEIINNFNKELAAEKILRDTCEKDLEEKYSVINELKLDLNKFNEEREALNIILKENEKLIKSLQQREPPVCNGSCAKVIEVQLQLSEETAKVDGLKQQIESLQCIQDEVTIDKVTLVNKYDTLQNQQLRAEKELEERQKQILCLQKEIQVLQIKVESGEKAKDEFITKMNNEKDAIINNVNKELVMEKILRETCQKDIEEKNIAIDQLEHELIQLKKEWEALNMWKIENEELIKELEHREMVVRSEANDFEVQLSEEKLKVGILKQQIESLQEYQLNVEKEIEEGRKEVLCLQKEIQVLQSNVEACEKDSATKEELISKLISEKDTITKELTAEKILRERCEKDIEEKNIAINQLNTNLSKLNNDTETLIILKKENEELMKTIGQRETSVCSEAYVYDLEVQLNEERAKVDDLKQQIEVLKDEMANDKITLDSKSNILRDYQSITEKESIEKQKEIEHLKKEIEVLQNKIETFERDSSARYTYLSEIIKEKDATIDNVNKELITEKNLRESYQKVIEEKNTGIRQLKHDLIQINNEREALNILKRENEELIKAVGQRETAVCSEAYAKVIEVQLTEERIKVDDLKQQIKYLQDELANDKVTLVSQCDILQDYQLNAEKEVEERQKESSYLQKEIEALQSRLQSYEYDSAAKDDFVSKMIEEKEEIINNMNKELIAEKNLREIYQRDVEEKNAAINQLKNDLIQLSNQRQALNILKKENEELIKAVGQRETFMVFRRGDGSTNTIQQRKMGYLPRGCRKKLPRDIVAVRSQDNASSQKNSGQLSEKELRELHHQVDNSSDSYSSIESLKTISDLEKIIHDKNRTITVLQTDITYLKNLMADSETKLLDVSKELEMTKENCHQLSSQLKKIVYQKNVEIADLKKQVNKMSVNETRATQIIKVSAKYQAIILKRIAEIKCNTVLKELTNYGNTNNSEDDLRRSLNAGTITMEDLENFLETTERHIKKCSEKQSILQKERDRLAELNRINESETINLKKFLTELSVSFQTFSSIKDLYAQKLSRVISVQRTVRREILNLDGHITDACMLKLERGYAAVMQDLSECIMNLERWVERCIGRTISSEKIKQAFMNDNERTSLAPSSVKNTGLEVQLDELESSFQRLLEEVSRAQKGEGAKEVQAVTVMEVRAEYEDKLNRMKAKMKQLYAEQIAVFKEKQKEEIAVLERELVRAREKLTQSSQRYEEHIRGLTSELWTVGEKFLRQKDEAEWLRRHQRSGSLMSLQHVRSAGLGPMEEEPGRPSDTHSLRSLPVNSNRSTKKRETRGLHMSDEEEELFDNRLLKDLAETPRRESVAAVPGERLSVLQWRNSLCPPHLKSSYPAETQFVPAVDEDEIKAMGTSGVRQQRKEVGITAYKKPGPPTPSKQAGRLSATDSELRESLRVEAGPQPSRKTSTPSRIRSLFRTSKNYTAELNETPRTRRLSNIFRKKN